MAARMRAMLVMTPVLWKRLLLVQKTSVPEAANTPAAMRNDTVLNC